MWRRPGGRAFLGLGTLIVLALAGTHVDAAGLDPEIVPAPVSAPALPASALWTIGTPDPSALPPTPAGSDQLYRGAAAWPPSADVVVALVRATFPEDPARAERIVRCESHAGQASQTYDLDASHAGPMQLARSVWEPFFREHYGWSWEMIVTDLPVHLRAARIVWERGSWAAWECR